MAAMTATPDQILSVAQMRAAEQALVAGGTSVDDLMQRAGRGAAEYVWRISAGRAVTVLCGPGNNGGDGYVIAEVLRARGLAVAVVAAAPPATEAAKTAAALYRGDVRHAGDARGEVLVDCLFGSGLSRALSAGDMALLTELARRHAERIAIDLPSGVNADDGTMLNPDLPEYHLTIALGAWKPGHALMPAAAKMGALRLVDIGVGAVAGAGRMLRRPQAIAAPARDAHKYSRGCLGIVAGAMPGAAVLAARAAQGAGAGYVRLIAERGFATPPELPLVGDELLADERLSALLVGPGLGRDARGLSWLERGLRAGFERGLPLVLDADALRLLTPKLLTGRVGMMPERQGAIIATPHEGEFAGLETAFGCPPQGSKIARSQALARASGMVVVAKGPDTVIAAPDGAWAVTPLATSWLSTAGSGDVLAGCIASRLACGAPTFAAAAQGVWLQAEAGRRAGVAFTASDLAGAVRGALATCL